jgi:hypothetical protein
MAATVTTPETSAVHPGTCALCHTVDYGVTLDGLNEGLYWRCARCGQMWDGTRITAVAAYTAATAAHSGPS